MTSEEFFLFRDAADVAEVSIKQLLSKAVIHNTPLFYNPSTKLHLYCLSIDHTFTPPFMANFDILNNSATSYTEVQDYDYIVIDSMTCQHILNTKICHLESFDHFAKLNTDGSIRLVSAKYFIINNDDKMKISVIKQLNLKASFYFFKERSSMPSQKIRGKIFHFPPIEQTNISFTIDELWISSSNLNTLYPDTLIKKVEAEKEDKLKIFEKEENIEALRCIDITYEWMGDNLKLLNRACMERYILLKKGCVANTDEFNNIIKKYIVEEYKIIHNKEIAKTPLEFCLKAVLETSAFQNMQLPSPDAQQRYHESLSPSVININELAYNLYTHHLKESKKTLKPSKTFIKEKAQKAQVMPKGMINHLVPFMLPNF